MPESSSPLQNKPDKPVDTLPDNPWPLLAALALAMVGVGYGVISHWRRASVMVAVAMAAAGLMRLLLPTRIAGLLAVRRRWFDVTVYLGLAAAITVVAFVVPPAR